MKNCFSTDGCLKATCATSSSLYSATKAVIAAVFTKTKTKPMSFKNREKAVVEAGRVVHFIFLHVSGYFDVRQ